VSPAGILEVRILDILEVKKFCDEATAEIERLKALVANPHAELKTCEAAMEELRVQVREAFAARDEAQKQAKKLRDLLTAILDEIESSPKGSMGSIDNTYLIQIGVERAAGWRDQVDPKPIPMCRPDALEDLFPESGGNPT
jgi:hypothetical protein